jgi:ElaB/YqjD/DUF883 family membrane-anchored ribosome-binding protein
MSNKYETKVETAVAKTNISNDLSSIKSDLSSLKTNIVGLAKDALENGTENLTERSKQATRELGRLRTYGAEKLRVGEDYVREKPSQSVAVAFIAGILVNMLFSRK